MARRRVIQRMMWVSGKNQAPQHHCGTLKILLDWERALLSQATFEAGLMRTIIGDPTQELQCDFENTL